MAYNSYFPTGYQPYYPQYQAPMGQQDVIPNVRQGNPQPMQNTPQNSLIWVQGEAGAKAYPVAPNTTVQLWDSEAQIVYLKSADASGMPSMKILDYTIRENSTGGNALQKPQIDLSGFVTREEFERKIAELRKVKDDE